MCQDTCKQGISDITTFNFSRIIFPLKLNTSLWHKPSYEDYGHLFPRDHDLNKLASILLVDVSTQVKVYPAKCF